MQFKFMQNTIRPGTSVELIGPHPTACSNVQCNVMLGDGTKILGCCSIAADAALLRLPAYTTRDGCRVEAIGWMLKPGRQRDKWVVERHLLSSVPNYDSG